MNLTKYSKNKLMQSFVDYKVPRDFADPIYNYIVFGFNPGSFFTGMLENNFFKAMRSCHTANTVEAIKNTTSWIANYLPFNLAWGSEKAVAEWLKMSAEDRRKILEERGIIYPEKQEIIMVLKDEPTKEPFFW